ncbi:MAG: GIY-YIG nuclease family protein [Syntrophomonadaceae bacterium]|nr:GIY-YIG nuclease family protein [Syntrophomonadaceae bacterium]MDD3889177.1 GIY-YIG nuclease family protein [Syntrophomonadaceae bacterium]
MDYVYILRCRDGSLYTGYTTDINRRVKEHNQGTGSKYTRSRLPVECVYTEELVTRSEALKREAAIKKLTHQQKEILIASAKG